MYVIDMNACYAKNCLRVKTTGSPALVINGNQFIIHWFWERNTIGYFTTACDSMGNSGVIGPGDCQWMTAGSGIIHQEMPKPSKRMLGAQLWLNLPSKDKMATPAYRPITKDAIPVVDIQDSRVHVICGQFNGKTGSIMGDYVKAVYLDIELDKNAEFAFETDPDHTLFIYIISGEILCGNKELKTVAEKHVVLFTEGTTFKVMTSNTPTRFLLMSGKPIKEPIAWGGPIVMNTRDELDLAFQELDNNTFIKS